MAAAPELLLDVNDATLGSIFFPVKPVELNGVAYFAAVTDETGLDLWRSDGTESGTSLLIDLFPTDDQYKPGIVIPLGVVGDELFFSADDSTRNPNEFREHRGLWKTDGTVAGTVKVHDVLPYRLPYPAISFDYSQSGPILNGELFFPVSDPDEGLALWKTDGTTSGTKVVKQIGPNAFYGVLNLTVVGDQLFFVADDGVHGEELWKSDGTAFGTHMVKDIEPGAEGSLGAVGRFFSGPYLPNMLEFQGELYFTPKDSVHGRELWKSDGTESGTQMVADIAPGSASGVVPVEDQILGANTYSATLFTSAFPRFAATDQWLYFTANDENDEIGELWKTDGTSEGTVRVANGPELTSREAVLQLTEFGGKLLFTAPNPIQSNAIDLWVTEETSEITEPIFTFADSSAVKLNVAGDHLFILQHSIDEESPGTLWVTDGTTLGTELILQDIYYSTAHELRGYGEANLFNVPSAIDDELFFPALDLEAGLEMWASDGTSAGTRRVKDIATSITYNSYPNNFTVAGNQLFFTAYRVPRVGELWVSDGTTEGTRPVQDLPLGVAGAAGGTMLEGPGELLYSSPDALWRSDGTHAGTYKLGGSEVTSLYAAGDRLYFSAKDEEHGRELWISDGTEAGTHLLANITPFGGSSAIRNFTQLGDYVYFLVGVDNINTGGNVWRTDGTAAGTEQIFGFTENLIAVGNKLFFNDDDQVWISDGTTSGTVLALDRFDIGNAYVESRGALGDKLITYKYEDGEGRELWAIDSEAFETTKLATVYTGQYTASPDFLGVADNKFFLEVAGKLWVTDGTPAGTNVIADLNYLGKETTLMKGDQELFIFIASFPGGVPRLWQSDGTPEGTFIVDDDNIKEVQFYRPPRGMATLNNVAYYSGFDPATGYEPYRYDPAGPNANPVVTIDAPEVVVRGLESSVRFTADDTVPDEVAGFTWHVDWNFDGVADVTFVGAAEVEVSHTFFEGDSLTFQAWAVDQDGGVSGLTQASVEIAAFALLPDEANPELINLVYAGTPGVDAVFFLPTGPESMLIYTQLEDGQAINRLDRVDGVTGRLIAHSRGTGASLGSDLFVAQYLSMSVELHGGDGNDILVGGFGSDTLIGGPGHDILLGGTNAIDGDDVLQGGEGRDLLFGHLGADLLDGGGGEDLLVGDRINFANTASPVYAIQAEWLSSRDYATRLANLSGVGTGPRLNGSTFLTPGATILDDSSIDTLTGGFGLDWYLLSFFEDLLTDAEPDEEATDVSLN